MAQQASTEAWYVQFPMSVFNRLPELSGAEIKVFIYIQRHTKNYGVTSRILSVDEIANGRMRKDGSRMDAGTGLSERAIRNAISRLEEKGLLMVTNERGGYRAFSLLPTESQPQGRQKVSMVGSSDRQKVSLPASDDRQKVPDPAVKSAGGARQKVPEGVAENTADSLVENAQEEEPPAPRDTLQDTFTDTSLDAFASLSPVELASDIHTLTGLIDQHVAELRALQEKLPRLIGTEHRLAKERVGSIKSRIPLWQQERARKQVLLDELNALMPTVPTPETLEEPPSTAEFIKISEQQEQERKRRQELAEVLPRWRNGLKFCQRTGYRSWEGHSMLEIIETIRAWEQELHALRAAARVE